MKFKANLQKSCFLLPLRVFAWEWRVLNMVPFIHVTFSSFSMENKRVIMKQKKKMERFQQKRLVVGFFLGVINALLLSLCLYFVTKQTDSL